MDAAESGVCGFRGQTYPFSLSVRQLIRKQQRTVRIRNVFRILNSLAKVLKAR
jgi:hypothetical protein